MPIDITKSKTLRELAQPLERAADRVEYEFDRLMRASADVTANPHVTDKIINLRAAAFITHEYLLELKERYTPMELGPVIGDRFKLDDWTVDLVIYEEIRDIILPDFLAYIDSIAPILLKVTFNGPRIQYPVLDAEQQAALLVEVAKIKDSFV